MVKLDNDIRQQCNRLSSLFCETGINLQFDADNKKILFDQYVIYYSSILSVVQTLEEVFMNMAYAFNTSNSTPFIVDAGSEVGMATIFFKIYYPKAKILCFEAHPHAYKLLQRNIAENNFEDITVVNAALANREGTVDFFGEFNCVGDDLDTRGSSIIKEWGLQRDTSGKVEVKATRLSSYVNQPVDYLKLNIEGAEQQVIEDLESANKLDFIDRLLIKFHYSPKTKMINDLDYTLWTLHKNKFVIKNKLKKNVGQIFSGGARNWAEQNEVSLYTLSAERADNGSVRNAGDAQRLQDRLYLNRMALLSRENFLLRSVIDSVPSSIYWKDKNGCYLGHSAYAVEKLHETKIAPGITSKNIVGKSDYDIFDKAVADKYRKNDLYIMENKKSLILEEDIFAPDGRELIQLSSKQPLYDEKMEVIGVIGSTVDITDRRKSEQLQKEKEFAEKTSKILKILSGSIAHEIRTPLTTIGVNLDRLVQSRFEGSDYFVSNIKLAINRMASIIEMLLIKMRTVITNVVPSGNKLKPISIKDSINEVINEYPFYESELQKIVWKSDLYEDFYYRGSSVLTRHLLFNLIKNALRAILNAEKGDIHISLKTNDDGFNQLIFRDSATGIRGESINSIFLPFTSNSDGGTGLGLAFCKMVMEQYGGRITCNSIEGEYTEFVLSFPAI